MTLETVIKDIDELFSDTRVSMKTTIERLEEIQEECDSMIKVLRSEIRRKKKTNPTQPQRKAR